MSTETYTMATQNGLFLLTRSVLRFPRGFVGTSTTTSATPLPKTYEKLTPFSHPPFNVSETSVLNLGEEERIFASLSMRKLLQSAAVLHAVAVGPMVDMGMWVMNSKLLQAPIIGSCLLGAIKHTFLEQFCAGEDHEGMVSSVEKLWQSGLRTMVVYGVEDAYTEDVCDQNFEGFERAIELTSSLPESSVSFVIVKITAICPLPLLLRVSDQLRWQKRDASFKLPWKVDTLPLFSDSTPLYHTPTAPRPLSPEEELGLKKAESQLNRLCEKCREAGVRPMVDAEYTSVQPAIDYLTYLSAVKYNSGKTPLIYGTMQAYLKDAGERMVSAVEAAQKMGIALGFKLVRGAYMSSEAEVAASLGHLPPFHSSIDGTRACFDACASFMLHKISSGYGALVLGTHNYESVKVATRRSREVGIGRGDERVQFAQLYGMSESLSLGLKGAGFVTNKYTPYGPLQTIIPYLLRRAEENRGMLAATSPDTRLLRREIWARMKSLVSPKSSAANEASSHGDRNLLV